MSEIKSCEDLGLLSFSKLLHFFSSSISTTEKLMSTSHTSDFVECKQSCLHSLDPGCIFCQSPRCQLLKKVSHYLHCLLADKIFFLLSQTEVVELWNLSFTNQTNLLTIIPRPFLRF